MNFAFVYMCRKLNEPKELRLNWEDIDRVKMRFCTGTTYREDLTMATDHTVSLLVKAYAIWQWKDFAFGWTVYWQRYRHIQGYHTVWSELNCDNKLSHWRLQCLRQQCQVIRVRSASAPVVWCSAVTHFSPPSVFRSQLAIRRPAILL